MALPKKEKVSGQSKPSEPKQKKSSTKKPEKFVKLVQGTQFQDPEIGVIYIVNQITPVERITNWVRLQAEAGLFEIIE